MLNLGLLPTKTLSATKTQSYSRPTMPCYPTTPCSFVLRQEEEIEDTEKPMLVPGMYCYAIWRK